MNLKTGVTLGLMVVIGLAIRSGLKKETSDFAIVIHGGARTITRKNMTPEKESTYRFKFDIDLNPGFFTNPVNHITGNNLLSPLASQATITYSW